MIVSLLERPAGTAADYGEPFVYRDIHAHIPVRMRIRLLTFGVLVRRVGSACWFGVLVRRVGPPSATGSGVLVLPARQGAACCPPSATGSCVLCVGPPSATGSGVLVLPARQGAVCSGVLVLPARQGLQTGFAARVQSAAYLNWSEL